MVRKIVSFICLLSIFIESVPVNALSYGISDIISQETTQSNSNNDTVDEKSDSKDNAKEVISNLEDNTFNAYINGENELAFSIGFDKKESKFIVKNQSEKQLAKDKLDTIIYKISVYDKENNEKLNVELLGSDTGNTEKLNILNETKYEIGDTIKITSLDPKNGLKILGDIQGDIDKNKEDYSDGVDNLDYITNVRFEITENNLKTVYNEAPVFEGLTDLLDVESPDIDVFEGVKVTDDHDGTIDNSKVVLEVQEKTESSAVLKYTVEDSWGRITSATRNVSAKAKINSTNLSENGNASKTTPTNTIESNTITVEGVPYHGNITERFKIKFDTASKSIKVIDEDGRVLSNTEKGEYFKVVLYDKDMVEKTSVTLLGTDKSDSEKLEAINNQLFEEGDYIGIWHAESEQKLKIGGTVKQTTKGANGELTTNGQTEDYSNGLPKKEIYERRFIIKNTGLEEVNNNAPTIGELDSITIARGQDIDLMKGVKEKITDDFDTFNDDSIEHGDVSITHSPFDNTKVGIQTITYTATDKWGRSSTQNRTITVTSENPLDYTYIEFMNPSNSKESLFKIKIDPVKKQLVVDNLDNLSDRVIDQNKSSSIFKLKVYTKEGILQKTLNIKGTDKLKTVLRRINGYSYSDNDRIELWSTTPENIKVVGQLKEDDKTNSNVYKNYVPNEKPTDDVINGDYKEDYENGINDPDYMKNVRFEIGSTNLKYIYNQAPTFTINTELTAERNGEINYNDGISASDDYDGDLTKKITYTPIDTSTIGEKYIEYKVVDSWGRSTIVKRKVTVYPLNNLEHNYITIKNNQTNEVILSIRFDEDNKKFKVYKLDASNIPSNIDSEGTVLELKLIKKNRKRIFKTGDSIETITITKQELMQNNLSELENLVYSYGDYLSFDSYDYANGIFISAKSHILLNGFENEDQMANSRFEIKSEGLQMIYNNAPQIHGLEKTLYLYKGSQLSIEKALEGISVKDDLDSDINKNTIVVKKLNGRLLNSIDTNTIGDFVLTYELTDSWGRTTSGQRTVSIISKSVSNDIEFYDTSGSNKLFSLKYNPISHEFDVTRNEEDPNSEEDNQNTEEVPPVNVKNADTNEGSLESGTEQGSGNSETQPDSETNPTLPKNVVFRLNVFNTAGDEVGKLELSEEEISSPESFNELSNISIYDDYYFSVWSNTSTRIKIQGDIEGDNTLGESENEHGNYENGISNDDHMNNVRFKLKTDGLEAVYNKAPKIILKSRNILTAYAGDSIDYTSGVIVEDDHDKTIPNENIIVDKVKDKTEETLEIGENTVNLSVTDSWGRTSNINRKLIIGNGIDKNTIRIIQSESEDAPEVMSIGFDYTTNKLVITDSDNQFVPSNDADSMDYIDIIIKQKQSNGNYSNVVSITYNAKHKPNSDNKLNGLKNYTFGYGDRIYIRHHHPTRFKIDGKVIDAREDYTDAVQNPENLINTEFEITNSGLKAIYTNPDANNVTDNKVVIGPMAPEKFPFRLQFDPNVKQLTIVPNSAVKNSILHKYSDNRTVYKFTLIGQDGRIKKNVEFQGRTDGREVIKPSSSHYLDNINYEYGDAIYLWHIEPERSILKGNIINEREDYSNGVNNPDNMNNVVFKLTEQGLKSVYNEAPKIKGANNIDVYQGSDFNLLEGITITDDFDTGKLRQISINGQTVTTNNDGTILTPNNIDFSTSTPGEQTVTYTATDRWGNTTTINRKITVRPNLYKNVFKVFSDENNNNDSNKPIFEIGFDTVNDKYRVFNQKNEKISSENSSETAFNIKIIGKNKEQKANITLIGNDRGNDTKLSALNNIQYEDGDIIRVYRRNLDGISLVGDVTGDIPSEDDDMSNDTNKFDYMMNTGFKVNNAGLIAQYNKAPELNGVGENKTVSKGETVNLLDGLTVSDDKDYDISLKNINIYINGSLLTDEENSKSLLSNDNVKNYTFNNLGTYDIEYMLYDSWGRAILKELTITVQSKVRDNEIEVYDSDNVLAFKVKFDTTNNQFILTNENTPTTYNSSSTEDKYFEMVVRNIKGEEKYKVTLNGNSVHDTEQLKKIHEQEFSKYDTIALYGKTAEAVKIKGNVIQENNNSRLSNQDYTTGFGNTDRYPLVRFKITDDGLKEMTQKIMTVSGLNNKSIKRGDDIDLLSGVQVDVKDTNNEDYKIVVNKEDEKKLNNLREGEYNVRYRIINSWGAQIEEGRTITVEPRTELEKVKLSIKNNRGETILTIGFDSIKRKLRVIDYKVNENIDSNNTSLAFAINAYDTLGNTLGTIELNGTQQIDESLISRLNNFAYTEGYRLSIWANNPETHLTLDGDINVSNNDTRKVLKSSKIGAVDKMENGRFEILDNGLTYIYNQAPEIQGGDTPIDYYKGTLLNIPSDITVSDDHDTISNNQVIIDDDNVDYDELGLFDITYMVEDTWGRVGTKEGKINIKSSMDSNIISIHPKTVARTQDTSSSAFDIKFVRDEDENKNNIIIVKNNTTQFNPSSQNDTFMNIKIYGADGKEKKSVDLLGMDNGNSDKLNTLNNFEYERGDYIAIEGVTEDTKSCVRIQGTIINKKEGYTNGVENIDNIQNVRFKFTDLGLESVYNEAPKITIDDSVKLDAIKGDDIPYMRGVKLKDDHDKLTEANVEVTFNPTTKTTTSTDEESYNDVIKGVAKVGENTLQYKVTDNWGRSVTETREVNLTNGILDNIVTFRSSTSKEFLKMKFEENNDDSDNVVKLKLEKLSYNGIIAQGGNYNYYSVRITKPNSSAIVKHIYSEDRYTDQFGEFDNMDLPYGTIIEFYEVQHPNQLTINGPVRNQREDYSDGVQNAENYTNTKFKVTDSGLKSIYEEPDDITNNKNIISVISKESIPLKFKIDPATKKISVLHYNHVTFYWELGPNIDVFRITLKGKDGRNKFDITGSSREKGKEFRDKFNTLVNNHDNSQSYEIGDTLTIWHKTPSRIAIKGNVKGAREDYSNGVDNSNNLTEAVFTLTATGLEAVYKDAPKIVGVRDARVLKGETLNLRELVQDIRATDSIDGTITQNVSVDYSSLVDEESNNASGVFVIGKNGLTNDESVTPDNEDTNTSPPTLDEDIIVVPDKVGVYEVQYSVTNTNDRTTRKSSTVVVYDKPTITESDRSRIELNSVENNDEAIKERLKDSVVVIDEDDKLFGKETKLEVLDHNVIPNEEGSYTATYKATDLNGATTEQTIDIQVTRTINVSVPTTIPFQVVTNLNNKEADPFIAGVMKVQNNNTSDVDVSIASFTREETPTTKNGNYKQLQIVDPESENWDDLSQSGSMTKMALGIYNKNGLTVDSKLQLTKEAPLWLKEGMDSVKLGRLKRANTLKTPYESKLSFTSKHGKKFIGGTSKGKFNLVFKFE